MSARQRKRHQIARMRRKMRERIGAGAAALASDEDTEAGYQVGDYGLAVSVYVYLKDTDDRQAVIGNYPNTKRWQQHMVTLATRLDYMKATLRKRGKYARFA